MKLHRLHPERLLVPRAGQGPDRRALPPGEARLRRVGRRRRRGHDRAGAALPRGAGRQDHLQRRRRRRRRGAHHRTGRDRDRRRHLQEAPDRPAPRQGPRRDQPVPGPARPRHQQGQQADRRTASCSCCALWTSELAPCRSARSRCRARIQVNDPAGPGPSRSRRAAPKCGHGPDDVPPSPRPPRSAPAWLAAKTRALGDVHTVYAPAVLAYPRRYVGPDEAEDVLQRTFLDVWRSAGRFDSRQRFTSWLFTIAHHRAVDASPRPTPRPGRPRGDPRDAREDGRAASSATSTRPTCGPRSLSCPITSARSSNCCFGDLTQREIAAKRGVPGTVKARVRAGTRRLGDPLPQRRGSDER